MNTNEQVTVEWIGYDAPEVACTGRCRVCRARDVELGHIRLTGIQDGVPVTWGERCCSPACAARWEAE